MVELELAKLKALLQEREAEIEEHEQQAERQRKRIEDV
jgi:hypothetical protein